MKNFTPDLAALRNRYPQGARVALVRMDDAQAPPIGTAGTVTGVDDIGSILVNWDNGSHLSVAYGVDAVRVISRTDVREKPLKPIRFCALIRDALSGEEEDYPVCYPWICTIDAATRFIQGRIEYPWMIVTVQEV